MRYTGYMWVHDETDTHASHWLSVVHLPVLGNSKNNQCQECWEYKHPTYPESVSMLSPKCSSPMMAWDVMSSFLMTLTDDFALMIDDSVVAFFFLWLHSWSGLVMWSFPNFWFLPISGRRMGLKGEAILSLSFTPILGMGRPRNIKPGSPCDAPRVLPKWSE